jgi:hypothetical protein
VEISRRASTWGRPGDNASRSVRCMEPTWKREAMGGGRTTCQRPACGAHLAAEARAGAPWRAHAVHWADRTAGVSGDVVRFFLRSCFCYNIQ